MQSLFVTCWLHLKNDHQNLLNLYNWKNGIFSSEALVHAEVWGVLILVSIFGLNDQLVVIHGIFVDSY